MTISMPVLIGIFLLCCTGCAHAACERLGFAPGRVAAVSLAAALLTGVAFQPWQAVSVHPASLLLLAASLIRMGRFPAYGLLVALTGATLGWLLRTLFPAFMEPCLFIALPTALLSMLFLKNRRERLVSTFLSPLLSDGLTTLSDWYLFDDGLVALGSGFQLDAQACGGLLLMVLLSAPRKKSVLRTGFHQNEA